MLNKFGWDLDNKNLNYKWLNLIYKFKIINRFRTSNNLQNLYTKMKERWILYKVENVLSFFFFFEAWIPTWKRKLEQDCWSTREGGESQSSHKCHVTNKCIGPSIHIHAYTIKLLRFLVCIVNSSNKVPTLVKSQKYKMLVKQCILRYFLMRMKCMVGQRLLNSDSAQNLFIELLQYDRMCRLSNCKVSSGPRWYI